LLGDKDENMAANLVKYQRLQMLDRVVKILPYLIAFYFVFIKYDLISFLKN
jgi:hypothetical protein